MSWTGVNTPRSADRPIFLTGFMGAGKSTLGPRLALELRREFYDLDHVVEDLAGKTVSAIFSTDGERAFRALETEALTLLSSKHRPLIALGGGSLLSTPNRELISSTNGQLVYLKASREELLTRIHSDAKVRPLFSESTFERRLSERLPGYESATIQVDTTGRDEVTLVSELLTLLGAGQVISR